MGNLKIMRLALAVVVACAIFLSGLAIGAYSYGKLSKPPQCSVNEKASEPIGGGNSQPAPAAGGLLLQGTVTAVTSDSLTINAANPDPAKAKETATTTVSISPETVIVERMQLSPQEIDGLMKKAADESRKAGAAYVPPKAYEERTGRLSDIKPGDEVGVTLSGKAAEKPSNLASQIYYYSPPNQ